LFLARIDHLLKRNAKPRIVRAGLLSALESAGAGACAKRKQRSDYYCLFHYISPPIGLLFARADELFDRDAEQRRVRANFLPAFDTASADACAKRKQRSYYRYFFHNILLFDNSRLDCLTIDNISSGKIIIKEKWTLWFLCRNHRFLVIFLSCKANSEVVQFFELSTKELPWTPKPPN
jgi:hypothetical protein